VTTRFLLLPNGALLDAVLPEDPGVDGMRGSGPADCELPELLRLQAAGFPLGDACTFGHA